MAKPTVFIGSSTEQLPTANALAECLWPFATPTVWDNAEFELNEAILEGLLKTAEVSDYAVFVFEPDDVTRIRNVDRQTVRDNVLFEFGLFIGRIGKGRAFWTSARSVQDHHIATDLLGITISRSLGQKELAMSPWLTLWGQRPSGYEAPTSVR